MAEIVFGGVSPRSLGDLLKGYGVMALVGETFSETLFWWDHEYRLRASLPPDGCSNTEDAIADLVVNELPRWAEETARAFQPTRQKSCDKPLRCPDHPGAKPKGQKKTCPVVIQESTKSPLTDPAEHDFLDPTIARAARAIALPTSGRSAGQAQGNPIFPGYGQEASGNYFAQLEKMAGKACKAPGDLAWCLFAEGSPRLSERLESGYLFFPEAMKRYATGTQKWVREKDAPRSAWCFILAMRGAMLLRGTLRSRRWDRRTYSAFPFVFRGSAVEAGRDAVDTWEIHLPTWTWEHPRTLDEFELQVHQFHARFRTGSFAATAAEFRAAVVGRAAGVAFDAFHRFVLEPRRPGRERPMPQGIPRGLTRVGAPDVADLRLMLAPLAETGWIDQFERPAELRLERARFDEAVHRAVDRPSPETYLAILEALWRLDKALLVPGRVRRQLEDDNRTPIPVPPLPPRSWEAALARLMYRAEFRLGRAIGSIQGAKQPNGDRGIGPLLEHLLPLKWSFERRRWEPVTESTRPHIWRGARPELEFGRLFWQRWVDSQDLDCLPFEASRPAPLADVAALLEGKVDIGEVHRLVPLFALLDWRHAGAEPLPAAPPSHAALPPAYVALRHRRGAVVAEACEHHAALPPAYVALRLWLDLGIHPPESVRPPRDGSVARLLALGTKSQVEQAAERALARLRITGLPWNRDPRPTGKAVARFVPVLSEAEARRMAAAVLAPISKVDTLKLSRRLWVAADDRAEREE
jgi:CRISPR-associated protein Csx17